MHAHRQRERRLRPIMHLADGVLQCAMSIRRRVIEIRHKTGSGAIVLMDERRNIYVLSKSSNAQMQALESVEHWIVGHYHDAPDMLTVMDDLAERAKECACDNRLQSGC